MKKILFLCTGNYYRSRFCEYFFNDLAIKEGKNWQAISRGLNVNPESGNVGAVSADVIEALESLGIRVDTSSMREPIQVQPEDLENVNKVVAVDEVTHRPLVKTKLPQWQEKIEYWRVKDLDENPSESPLLQLQEKINLLLREIRT
jgi:protein-tyrosine phosphatase